MSLIALLIAAAAPPTAPAPQQPSVVTTASGLRFETLTEGTGPAPQAGGAVLVTYEGRRPDGSLFDAAAEPVGLAVSDLVPGFTEALLMMRTGGTYRFTVPAALAYGDEGHAEAGIAPGAALTFTVTLHRTGRAAPPRD